MKIIMNIGFVVSFISLSILVYRSIKKEIAKWDVKFSWSKRDFELIWQSLNISFCIFVALSSWFVLPIMIYLYVQECKEKKVTSFKENDQNNDELKPHLDVRVKNGVAFVSREQVAKGMLWKLKKSLRNKKE